MNIALINSPLNKKAVILRDVWRALELRAEYSNWSTRWLSKFTQGIDFVRIDVNVNPTNGLPINDIAVTLEVAKHLALMSETNKGKEYRTKLIELEDNISSPTFSLPTNYLEALKELTVQVEIKEKALLKIEVDKPKVEFHDLVTEAKGELLSNFAKIFGMGRNKFYALLRDDGYLQLDNMPYQRYIKQGIFEVRESKPYIDRGGCIHTVYQTLLTGKGQVYFTKRYFTKEYTAQ